MHAVRKNVAKGFTLVEILIVVVILGILAAIVVPQFTNAANESRVGNIATQVATLESQLELFAARNNGSYPDLETDGWGTSADVGTMVGDGYLKEVPVNPFSNNSDINAWDSDGVSDSFVIYTDDVEGWYYDATTGNIAAAAPTSADPDAP